MKAKPRVSALRGRKPDDLAANGHGCDRISLRVSLMKRKITRDSPGIRGMSIKWVCLLAFAAPNWLTVASPPCVGELVRTGVAD
jgi:hypothetical protein